MTMRWLRVLSVALAVMLGCGNQAPLGSLGIGVCDTGGMGGTGAGGSDVGGTGGTGGSETAGTDTGGAAGAAGEAGDHQGGAAGASEQPVVHVVHYIGQSLALGPFAGEVPAGIPLQEVLFWNHAPTKPQTGEISWGEFRALDCRTGQYHGSELSFGLAMHAAGIENLAIIKFAQGSVSIDDFRPVDPEHADMWDKWSADETAAMDDLRARFPNGHFYHWFMGNQGQQETGSVNAVTRWKMHLATVETAIKVVIGIPEFDGVIWDRVNTFGLGDPAAVAIMRQNAVDIADRIVNEDDFVQQSGFHPKQHWFNVMGERQAAALLDLMAAKGLLN